MSFLKHIDKNIIENLMNSHEFKAWLISRRWFGDKFLLSNLDFYISLEYFEIIAERIFLTIIKISRGEDYEQSYFLPLLYYKNLNQILEKSEKEKDNFIKLTENTFSKKIAITLEKEQKSFTFNLLEAEFTLFFWKNMLFEQEITESFPKLSLKLTLYEEQFQDKENMKKVQNLIEASIYSERYDIILEQLGKGNTTNLLFKLTLINKVEDSEPISYVMKSYKEYSESLEPQTLFVLVKNNYPGAPNIYGTIKLMGKDAIGVYQYIPNQGNVGDIHWNELNEMIYEVFSDPDGDYSKLDETKEISQLIKDYCEATLQVSSEIAESIKKLHHALIFAEDSNYASEVVESDFYLSNYTQKLNLMISDLQYLMKQESENMFYNLPKISSVLIDTKDVLEKFRTEFQKESIDVQPVHQDLHMEQILYEKKNGPYQFYFMDFEGDPQLSLEEKKQKYPTEKDLASYLRSLSYIKFNTLLQYIEKKIVDKEKYVVSEEILYSLFFRKGTREKRKTLDALLRFLNKWEVKIMNKFLKDLNPSITLINYYTIERILHEVQYEMLFRPNKFIIPLLGLQEIIENN
ncbi:MAG: hypothetical protein BAJALOKI3v1_280031 [Promethearchaeota archaeon]|jgi:hypothetical protein|nr:MAG: hypothetical protein BAJALOKI3v1_280031 [Candidatus Lokiarchaeota archaeon]